MSRYSSGETKPGLYTSEFWAAVVLPWIVTSLNSADVINVVPDRWRWVLPIVAMFVNGLYAMSRGRAKQGIAPVERVD